MGFLRGREKKGSRGSIRGHLGVEGDSEEELEEFKRQQMLSEDKHTPLAQYDLD